MLAGAVRWWVRVLTAASSEAYMATTAELPSVAEQLPAFLHLASDRNTREEPFVVDGTAWECSQISVDFLPPAPQVQ